MCLNERSGCVDINKLNNWFQRKEKLGVGYDTKYIYRFMVIEIEDNLLPLRNIVIDCWFA